MTQHDDEPTRSHILAGRYQLRGMLGAGGMGSVFLALDTKLDELVAVKMLQHALLDQLAAEVKLARRVTHKNVARTFDIGEDGPAKFLTMEYISGESLGARAASHGPLPAGEIVRIAESVGAGLAAAHEVGVIHRDLKLGNVMIANDGRVVIMDFGIAVDRETRTADIAGTPQYMAPEQFEGAPANERTDIFSLGVLLYRISTGQKPFGDSFARGSSAPNPCHRRPDLPLQLGDVIARCMAPDPAARFESAAELVLALQRIPLIDEPAPPTVRHSEQLRTWNLRTIALEIAHTSSGAQALSEGLRETIRDRLSEHRMINLDVPERAEAVVTLDTETSGDRIRLRIWIASNGIEFWSATLEDERKRAVHLGLEAASRILEALALDVPTRIDMAALPPSCIEPYLEARVHLRSRDPARLKTAVDLLEQLLPTADHPLLVAAHAHCLARLSFSMTKAPELLAKAEAAVCAAPMLAEAHMARAFASWSIGDSATAARGFVHTLELAPGHPDARLTLGTILREAGAVRDGLRLIEDAVARVPTLLTAWVEIALAQVLLGRDDLANEALAKIPSGTYASIVALAYRLRFAAWRGNKPAIAKLLVELERSPHATILSLTRVVAQVASGVAPRFAVPPLTPDAVARRMIFDLQLRAEAAQIGNDESMALDALEEAVEAGLQDRLWLERCPLFGTLLGTQRFEAISDAMRNRARAVLSEVHDK